MGSKRYVNGFAVTIHDDLFEEPLSWKKPRLVFVNSMSDLFHESIPEEVIQRLFTVMESAPMHTFQILTKRAERLAEIAQRLPWPKNIWMGVTVEADQFSGRIDLLREVPAAIRFVSFEPLLTRINPSVSLEEIDWVIVGGESGPGARDMKEPWVVGIQDLCRKYQTSFFFKQWGGVNKKQNGRELQGKTWDEMPNQVPVFAF